MTSDTPAVNQDSRTDAQSATPHIYCYRCGQKNIENNFRCTRCGTELHDTHPPVARCDTTLGGLIPYKNSPALWAYYLSIFSLIPFLGIPAGVAAVILGCKGLQRVKHHPEVRGTAHAWTGILLGTLCAAGNVALWATLALSR